MSLFSKKNKNIPKSEDKKVLKTFDLVDYDLDEAILRTHNSDKPHCKIIASTDDYLFYEYFRNPNSSEGIVIRRTKANLDEKRFFGKKFDYSCIFHNYLFRINRSASEGKKQLLYSTSINDGITYSYDWFGDERTYKVINGFGHYYCQDSIISMFVEDNRMLINVKRERSHNEEPANKYDYDMNYRLVINFEEGDFKAVAQFPSKEEVESKKTIEEICNEKNKKERPSYLGKDASKHISCGYEDNTDECPDNCESCAISIKTDGDEFLASGQPSAAIEYYKKALLIKPGFAEAWVNLGACYGSLSKYDEAMMAYENALSIDPLFGKAMFGKAITLKNQGKLDESIAYTDKILELYDDKNVNNFKNDLLKLTENSDKKGTNNISNNRFSLSLDRASKLLADDEKKGLIKLNGKTPFIAELLPLMEIDIDNIFDFFWDACKSSDETERMIQATKLSTIWCCLCGIGATRLWQNNWNALNTNGVLNSLAKERGFDKLDEYVMDISGIGWNSPLCKVLMSRIEEKCIELLFEMFNPGHPVDEEHYLYSMSDSCRAMYYYGMILEMDRLGMV